MKKTKYTLLALGFATCLSTHANAAGFYIQEQSVSGLGTAYAGQTAMPRDASIIYYNPAGMTYLEGRTGNIGVHALLPDADLDDRGSDAPLALPNGGSSDNPYDLSLVPNLHYSHQLSDQWWAGVSVTAPFGLGNEYDDGWFGRYDSLKSELKTINVQPSVAYRLNDKVSLGLGIDVQYADAELTSAAFAGTEGQSKLTGDDISFGYNIGVMVDATPQTRLGFQYRSQINHKLDGEISATGTTGADAQSNGKANLNLPEMVSLGIAHDLNDRLTIMGNAIWFGWSNFERITAYTDAGNIAQDIAQGYEDTWAFSIGADYKYSDDWTLRAGVQYDQTPTEDEFRTTRTPDGDRIWVSGGATYHVSDRVSWDFALTYINVAEEDISVTRNQPLNATIEAESSGHVGIAAIGLNYKF
jgi:long-chain fatty acid transport protein